MTECIDITSYGRQLCIRFPGGASVCASPPGIVAPPPDELAQILMAQASPAMAPLQPIFDLIGAILAVKDVVEAIPSLLVDPTELIEAIAAFVEKVSGLAALLPPVSVPVLIVDIITTILKYIEGLLTSLIALAEQEQRIADARALAIEQDLADLLSWVECSQTQLDDLLENLQGGAGPVNNLLLVVNALGELAGIPTIEFGDLSGDISETVDQLLVLVETLTAIRDAIPI